VNIAFVGCGFVFDIYMRTLRAHPELVIRGVFDINPERMLRVQEYYGFQTYRSYDELLLDASIDTIINLTPIGEHYGVTKRALECGKHVYSEKPLTKNMIQSRELFEIAELNNVRLYAAPCNIFSDSVRTIYREVDKGSIGKPLIVYAELDDNPINLMAFENVKSVTGAPWPLREEILEGCTFEHIGYHLVWICGLLGPAIAGTGFSAELIESKMESLPGKVGTPDYSVACLSFASGATARITCSVVAPRDHTMRVVGSKGELVSDSYRHYRSPVYLEQYSKTSLNARKFRTLRSWPSLGRLFGIGGRKVRLSKNWKSFALEKTQFTHRSVKQRVIEWLRRREVYSQDKLVGVAEMAHEIANGDQQYLSKDFILHINELTLLIQSAGSVGQVITPTTTFLPIGPIKNGVDL
jgi:predicted dehydrogenase